MRRVTLFLCALVPACVPTEFDDLRGESPTIALAPPDDYVPSGFGAVLFTYAGDLGSTFASRIGISAGQGSPFSVYPLLIGEELDLETPVVDGCNDDIPCDPSAGRAFAGMPVYGSRQMCVAIPETATSLVHIRCEDDITTSPGADMGPTGGRFGWSAVGVPVPHPFGIAVVGAPGESADQGAVYRLRAGGHDALDLSVAEVAGAQIGSALAIAVLDDDSVIFATQAPGAGRVIVAVSDVAGDGTITTLVHDCLDDPAPGWGASLAFGDIDGDGVPDLVVGSGSDEGRLNVVRVYDGASMPAAGTCDGSWPSIELGCPMLDGVGCTDASRFGVAVATGDLDGDGIGDLLVGAPDADVGDVAGAGAVFVFRGGATLEELDDEVVALRHSSPSTGAELGASVATAPGLIADGTRRRDEAVAGAPGVDRVYVFLCTGLEGDTPASTHSTQCQPL